MSTLRVDSIQGQTADDVNKYVVQVVQKVDTSTTTFSNSGSSATFVTCGSLSQSFTPKFSNSKVLLRACLGHVATNTADRFAYFRFSGGNTANGVGDASGSRQPVLAFHYFQNAADGTAVTFEYLDSPNTTSAITYAVEIAPNYSNGNLGLNFYLPNNTNAIYIPLAASTLTIMEIAQ
tara:strand:+ start:44 stop:577 length:534 start_codon:yes stop_codon:yes gene_type:complete